LKKLILGTAQLNDQYGLLNSKKKNKTEIFKFLEFCVNQNIINFDTAEGYKNHKILGEFFNSHPYHIKPKIITKVSSISKIYSNDRDRLILFKKKIEKIIKDLSMTPNTLLLHDFNDNKFFKNNFNLLREITSSYGIDNLGFSIYEIKDISFLKSFKKITLQVPLNLANLEFQNNLNKKYKIIARSIFLQGLLINLSLKKVPNLVKKSYIKYVSYIQKHQINPLDLCMNFIEKQKIDKYIVGADNIYQLNKIISYKKEKLDYIHIKNINSFFSKKSNDPRLWS
jgi:aryl-alcohol dehydrogenase-like predicted oxidoreductase